MTITPAGFPAFNVSLAAVPSSSYNYDQPASSTAIAGSWSGFFSSSESGTVVVDSSGSFSTTPSLGCQISGTATPRASGKNVYDVPVSFGPAPCAVPNTSASGVAVVVGSGSSAQITVAVTDPARNLGGAFFGQR